MGISVLIIGFLTAFILILCVFWFINQMIYKIYHARCLNSPVKPAPLARNFSIHNPYNIPGEFHKAQLHLHTSNSKDVVKKEPVSQTIMKYQRAGYQFAVITDHDTVTDLPEFNDSGFLVIPGIEKTVPFPFWPFGKHLIKIGGENGMLMPAHVNWRGNLGAGSWYLNDLVELGDFCLIEINNHHSDTVTDIQLWHKILEIKGFQNPVWGVAVDDSDNGERLDGGWIMIKTGEVTAASFFNALRLGGFYATTGPAAEFETEGPIIKTTTAPENLISFINCQNQIISSQKGGMGIYQATGDEGFIRVEIQDSSGKTAWSQPFYVVPRNR